MGKLSNEGWHNEIQLSILTKQYKYCPGDALLIVYSWLSSMRIPSVVTIRPHGLEPEIRTGGLQDPFELFSFFFFFCPEIFVLLQWRLNEVH